MYQNSLIMLVKIIKKSSAAVVCPVPTNFLTRLYISDSVKRLSNCSNQVVVSRFLRSPKFTFRRSEGLTMCIFTRNLSIYLQTWLSSTRGWWWVRAKANNIEQTKAGALW